MKFGKVVNVRLTEEAYKSLEQYSDKNNISVSEAVRRAVRLFIFQNNMKKGTKKSGQK